MTTIALFNIVFVLLAYLAQYKSKEYLLKLSFFLIFLFLALRYNYGNDYPAYIDDFLLLASNNSFDYTFKNEYYEKGWLFLYYLFKPFGFFALITVLAAFNCFVYYHLIKKYVLPGYYWFAVFLYVFTPGFMVLHCSAMRQSLAIALFLFSIDYIHKKDAIRYFLCIGLASLFHSSALVLLPVYFLGIFDWKIKRPLAIIFFVTYILFFQFGALLTPFMSIFMGTKFESYLRYEGSIEMGSGLGLILNSSLFALILFYAYFQSKQTSLFFKIAILSYFIIPLSLNLSSLVRIGMYFDVAMIIVFPATVYTIKNPTIKVAILAIIVFITLYNFNVFFKSEVFKESFGTYQTIFSAPQYY